MIGNCRCVTGKHINPYDGISAINESLSKMFRVVNLLEFYEIAGEFPLRNPRPVIIKFGISKFLISTYV